jgi:acyl carrier protein
MNAAELRSVIVEELCRIAPEVEPAVLKGNALLRDQVDLDSIDWLNFLIALHKRLGVDIPEADYSRLVSIDTLLDYLGQRCGH